MLGAVVVQVANEVRQQRPGIDELEAQTTTHREIGVDRGGKIGHRAPGQGRANSLVSAGSTVA
jgi:hypothetical protein